MELRKALETLAASINLVLPDITEDGRRAGLDENSDAERRLEKVGETKRRYKSSRVTYVR